MAMVDESWSVATEVVLTDDRAQPMAIVRLLTFPGEILGDANASGVNTDLPWIDEPVRLFPKRGASASEALSEFIFRSERELDSPQGRGLRLDTRELDQQLREIPVPVFGSPPSGWRPLGTLLSGASGVAIANSLGSHDGVVWVLSATGMTLFMKIASPVSDAVGRGMANKIDRWFGSPVFAGSPEPIAVEAEPAEAAAPVADAPIPEDPPAALA